MNGSGAGSSLARVSLSSGLPIKVGRKDGLADLPARIGVGWNDFNAPGSGDTAYCAAGAAFWHPFDSREAKWRLRAEGLAVPRELGSPDGEQSTVVPLVLSIQVALLGEKG